MKCLNCGCELPDHAKFCFGCGAKVDAPEQEAVPQADVDDDATVILNPEMWMRMEEEREKKEECSEEEKPKEDTEERVEVQENPGSESEVEIPEVQISESEMREIRKQFSGSVQTEPEEILADEKADTEDVQSGQQKFCPHCGSRNDEDAIFCCSCGKNMNLDGGDGEGSAAKKKFPVKKAAVGVAVVVLAAGGVKLVSGLFGEDVETRIAYVKDRQMMQVDLAHPGKKPFAYEGKVQKNDVSYVAVPVSYSEDGTYICYPTRISDGEFQLNMQKSGKKGGSTEIDDSVNIYKLLKNNKIIYRTSGGNLYMSDIKKNKVKIASDVEHFQIDKDEKNIVWVESDGGKVSIYKRDLKLKKAEVELIEDVDEYKVSENLKQIAVKKDGNGYLISDFGEPEKVCSEIVDFTANNEKAGNIFYYKKNESTEDYGVYDLCCYQDGVEILIDFNAYGGQAVSNESETIIFNRLEDEEDPESLETCVYNGKEVVVLDEVIDGEFVMDGKKGYGMKSENDGIYELIEFDAGKDADGECTVINDEISHIEKVKDGNIYYMADVDEGSGDFYRNDEMIDADVQAGSIYFLDDRDETFTYMTDYSDSREKGTLKVSNGRKSKIAAEDVHEYRVADEKRIAVLVDYDVDDSEGDLKLYRGSSKLKDLDEDVSALFRMN